MKHLSKNRWGICLLVVTLWIPLAPAVFADSWTPAQKELPESNDKVFHTEIQQNREDEGPVSASMGEIVITADEEPAVEEADNPEAGMALGFSGMNRVSAFEAVVSDYAGLKAALESAEITHIYLSDHIQMTAGIQVNANKEDLIIDGRNPLQDNGIIYSITDRASLSQDQTIYLNTSGNLKRITLKYLVLNGANYYGSFSIYDSVRDVYLIYDNVEYYGPQMTFNRYGTTRYRDTTVELSYNSVTGGIGELAECPFVEFEGRVDVKQVSVQTNEIIYVALMPGSIQILEDAYVTVSTLGDAGFLYTEASAQTSITVHENAYFSYTAPRRFWENTGPGGVTVKRGGQMFIHLTEQVSHNALLRVNGDLIVEEEGVLHLTAAGKGAFPVLTINQGSIDFQRPRSILLYSPNYRAIYYITQGAFDLEANQVNYWSVPGSGGFEDAPLYSWRKNSGEDVVINGMVASGSSGNFTTITSNYDDSDLSASALPNADTFHMGNARVLAFGTLPLWAEYIHQSETETLIAGETAPDGLLSARYRQEEGDAPLGETQADDYGLFEIPVDVQSVADYRQIRVKANHWFLTEEVSLVLGAQTLRIYQSMPNMEFRPLRVSSKTVYAARKDPDWSILVLDTRGTGSRWRLWARVEQPLTPEGPVGGIWPPALQNALVFVNEQGEVQPLDEKTDLLVYQHTSESNWELTGLSWPEHQGPLVEVRPGEGYAQVEYSAVILWTLEDAP